MVTKSTAYRRALLLGSLELGHLASDVGEHLADVPFVLRSGRR
ncbi:hypothetical protein BH23ACT3_BH23ACT3_11630 [soil metagenome]